MQDLRFPIGEFKMVPDATPEMRENWIKEIESAAVRLREAVAGLSDEQLDTPYRPEGWTIRQVVHHLPDSHMNSYTRFKLALTEEHPAIRPYFEDRWAELEDGKSAALEISLALLESLHRRWVILLRSISDEDYQRTFFHPESNATTSLETNLATYAWHSNHHIAHIISLRERMGW